MPTTVPLAAIPNQELSIRLDGRRYTIALRECGDVMVATVTRDGVALVSAVRCVAGYPLLPYGHLSADSGNFIFTNTQDGAIPFYSDFGSTCQLVYSTAAEIAAAVADA